MDDPEKRQLIGDGLIGGRGYEVGAGLCPSRYTGVEHLTCLDIREKPELEALFKSEISYEVRPITSATVSADFLIAHHVVEHAANPIQTIIEWSALIKEGGRMFLSLPAFDHACEASRLPTPFEHVLHDYLFERDGDHFDSKQHIPHFINQWAALDRHNFWYAQRDVEHFAENSLREVRRSGHDLHWHTYSLDVLEQVVTTAFWLAGHAAAFLHSEHANSMLYIVVEKRERTAELPSFLRVYCDRLLRGADALSDRLPITAQDVRGKAA
jgi:predicted DNA-binding ribbon-helix-helix protein